MGPCFLWVGGRKRQCYFKGKQGAPQAGAELLSSTGFSSEHLHPRGQFQAARDGMDKVTAPKIDFLLPGDQDFLCTTSSGAWPRSWHLLAHLSFMVLQECAQAGCVLIDNLLLPSLPWTCVGETQYGRTYHFWNGAAGRPGHCSAESNSRKCGCMWKQADLKQYSPWGITQIIPQWQWRYLLSWQYEERISFYLLMVVSGFISLTASVATCCFPWCVSLVILFQLSLKSCLFEEGVGFVPQKGSCRDAQRAAPQMPEPVHIGCTVSKESSLHQPTLRKGEHSISNLQYGKGWEYLPINSCLSPALVSGMTMPAMMLTQKVSEVASSTVTETALYKAKHSCPQYMVHRQECLWVRGRDGTEVQGCGCAVCSSLGPCKWCFLWLQCRPTLCPCSGRLSQLHVTQEGFLDAGCCPRAEA